MGMAGFFLLLYLASATLVTVVGLPLPLSMPPLPEDPALLRIAARDSICCITWSGAADADPAAANHTEALCAEPEVRTAVAALAASVRGVLTHELGDAGGIAQGLFDLATTAVQRPGCVFLREMTPPAPGQPGRLSGGIALKLDDRMRTARTLLDLATLALRAKTGRDAELHPDVDVDDVTFQALPLPAMFSFVGWTEVDGWLLLAVGQDSAAPMLRGLRDQEPGLGGTAAVARLLAQAQVARPATRTFVDWQRLRQTLPPRRARTLRVLAALGLGEAGAALATTGLDGDGFRVRVDVDVPQPQGLLRAFAGDPVTVDALLPVPLDADLALAMRAEPTQLYEGLLQLGDALGLESTRTMAAFATEFDKEFGLSWQDDVLQHCDGQVTAWDAPSQGGLGFTAAAARFGLRDGAGFAAPFDRVMANAREHLPSKQDLRRQGQRPGRNQTLLETFEHRDQTAWWLDIMDDDVPFAFAWSRGPAALTLALSPPTLRSALDAADSPNPDRSLVRSPSLRRRGQATALLHLDLQSLTRRVWPLATMFFHSIDREWLRDGFDFDAADLPRLEALLPHLGQELSVLEPGPGSFAFTRTGTLPVVDPLTVLLLLTLQPWDP